MKTIRCIADEGHFLCHLDSAFLQKNRYVHSAGFTYCIWLYPSIRLKPHVNYLRLLTGQQMS